MKRVLAAVALTAPLLVALIVASPWTARDAHSRPNATISVQLLSFNDYHGNLEPPAGSGGRIGTTDTGGSEYFATHLAQLRASNPNTLVVGAGDMIGASPLLSALFHDEPTIESLSAAGLQITSVGNHEFDEGAAELRRMQRGGCHPKDGCQDGDPFRGARFQYLSANVELVVTAAQKRAYARARARYARQLKARRAACRLNAQSRACKRKLTKPRAPQTTNLLPPYAIRTVGGVRIGFIGMTLEGTPTIVTPSGVAGLRFLDEARTVNRLVPVLKRQRVETIVVLVHEGGFQTGDHNACTGISGPIVGITNAMSDEVDVVVSGHTHAAYNCMIGTKLVTSAASFGRLITDIDLTIDTATRDVVSKTAVNRLVTRTVNRDPAQTQLIEKYRRIAAPLANRVIGSITADITRAANAAGESALGDVIADAQLAASSSPAKGGAVIAFMNPGGIRADLTYNQISGGEQPGQVTYSEAFTVQPFGNTIVVKTMTGDQIKRVLEQQFDNPSPGATRILQVSAGFAYSYNQSNPSGSRIVSMTLNGQPISPSQSYRVTMNSFLADGGDNFTAFREGTNPLGGEVDLDALEAYFRARSPVAPGPRNRITRVG